MCKKLKYRMLKIQGGWIVTIEGREGHSHFRTKSGCIKLIKSLQRNHMPKGNYFKESARRILTELEFASLIEKEKALVYVNVPKVLK